jgi:hypothetical protein
MKRLILICAAWVLWATGGMAIADIIPWEGDPMELEGDMIVDDSVLCTGSGCGPLLDSFSETYEFDLYLLLNQPSTLDETATYTLAVSTEQLCKRLEEAKPKGCSSSSPPSVPGFDPYWKPNGCGVGGWKDAAVKLLADLGLRYFTGELDEPFPGVSFLNACNAHDRCYGLQSGKLACDGYFRLAMTRACDGGTKGDVREICYGSVSAYHAAVVNHGKAAYESAGEDYACAQWHQTMEKNKCET